MTNLNHLIERLCDADVDFVIVAASIEIHLFGRRCRVMSLEDLIRAKESLGREKDLLALKELRSLMDKSRS